jgi:hypothetical protein
VSKDPFGGPAFPREDYQTDSAPGQRGMTLRDYFAAHAIPEAMRQTASVMSLSSPPEPRSNAARIAYEIADAMLQERDK